MGKGVTHRPYNYFRFGKEYDRIFLKLVRKGHKAKATQTHINKKREEKKNPSNDWSTDSYWKREIVSKDEEDCES